MRARDPPPHLRNLRGGHRPTPPTRWVQADAQGPDRPVPLAAGTLALLLAAGQTALRQGTAGRMSRSGGRSFTRPSRRFPKASRESPANFLLLPYGGKNYTPPPPKESTNDYAPTWSWVRSRLTSSTNSAAAADGRSGSVPDSHRPDPSPAALRSSIPGAATAQRFRNLLQKPTNVL